MDDQDGALAALATAAAMLQEKEEERALLRGLEGKLVAIDKAQSNLQPQSSGHTTADATNLNNSNGASNDSKSISTGVLMVTPTDNLNGDKEEELEQKLGTGNKRGRLDTPAVPPAGVHDKEKMSDSDISVMSDKMKALSTSKPDSETNQNDASRDIPDYVRRGAKRASIADRQSIPVTIESKPEDESDDESKENEVMSRLSNNIFSPNESTAVKMEHRSSWGSANERQKGEGRKVKGRSLYSCLSDESASEDPKEVECISPWKRSINGRMLPRQSNRAITAQKDQCIIL